MKYLAAAISVVLLLLAVGAVSFYAGQNLNINISKNSNAINNSKITKSLTNAPTKTQDFRTIPSGGVVDYAAYTINIPLDWTYTKDDAKDIDTLVITKGNYKLQILQGGMGGAPCLYPGDKDVEGPSSRYLNFTEITTQDGIILRRGESEPQSAIGVCEKQNGSWGEPTSFGAISYFVPGRDPSIIKILDHMLASLKKK